jgi:hypothetical protein
MTKSNTLKSAALALALAIACVAQASAAERTMQEKMPAQAAVVHTAGGAKARVLNGYDYEGHAWSQRGQERDSWGHSGDYYGPMLALP